jgi:hypothetical protein
VDGYDNFIVDSFGECERTTAAGLATFTYDPNTGSTRKGTISFNNGAALLSVTQPSADYVAAGLVTLYSISPFPGIAVDSVGNVYIAWGDEIKKWDPKPSSWFRWSVAFQMCTLLLQWTPPEIFIFLTGSQYD